MGFFSNLSAWLRGARPAKVQDDTAHLAGFVQAPTSPAPDAQTLAMTEMVSAIVGRCVNVISEDAAHVPLRLFDVTTPNKPIEVYDHPAILLWRHINRVDSPVVYIEQLFADLVVHGNHFSWLDLDPAGVPMSMMRISPEQVKVVPDPVKIISGYTWKSRDGTENFYPDTQILHVRTRTPDMNFRGTGLLERARDQIRFERYLRNWKEFQIKNGIPTSMVVKVKRLFGNEAEFKRFQYETTEKLRGVENSGKPWFVKAEDVDVDVIPRPTEDEVAFINSLTYTRGEFAMLFGVPPSRLSDYSESFRSTSTEQTLQYWQDTIMSWHRLFLDYLNSTFIPRWFPNDVDSRTMMPRIQFAFDYSQVRALARSMRDMATVQEIMIRNAMRTPAKATIAMGDPMPDDPAADQLYMNGGKLGEDPLAGFGIGGGDGEDDEEDQPDSQPTGGENVPDDGEESDTGEEGRGGGGLGPGGSGSLRPSIRAVPKDVVNAKLEAEILRKKVDKLIAEMVRRAAEEEIELSGILGSFDKADPRVLEMVRTQAVKLSEAVTATLSTEVRKALAVAIEQGYTPEQMRKALRGVFKVARADWRLDRIAKTESHNAHEGGGLEGLRQNGVKKKKWLTGPNPRNEFRADHEHMDGMVREIDEPFEDPASGAQLMYPGDYAGAISGADIINCNCLKIADFSDVEDTGFYRNVDPQEARSRKERTRRKFEAAFKLVMRVFFKQMEARVIAELDRQVGGQRGAPAKRAAGGSAC